MCKGQRLNGPQARERVGALIDWLRQQAVLTTEDEANGLLIAARMASLRTTDASEAQLLHQLRKPAPAPPYSLLHEHPSLPRPAPTYLSRSPVLLVVQGQSQKSLNSLPIIVWSR